MAADTDTAVAPTTPEAPAPTPPSQNGTNQAPKSTHDVRSILGQGMRARAQAAAGLFPKGEPDTAPPLASQPGNGVVSGQHTGATPTATAAPSEPTPQESAPAPPAREAPPVRPADPAAVTPPERAEAPPQAQQATPTPPPAAPDQPTPTAPTTPAARPERPELPPEYATPEYQQRFANDPLLRREVLGIWRQPDTSDIAKANAIAKRVDASDKRIAAARSSQDRLRQLRQSGNLQEWAKQVDLQEAQQAYQQQWAQGVTQLLARTLGTDPNDEGFANAGAIQPGESEELRAIRFAEWAVANSPIAKTHVAGVTKALQEQHDAEIAQIRAAHEEELKSLRSRLEQEAAAQAAAALAQGRGTQTAFPPRAPDAAADGTEAGLSALPATVRDVRGLLGAGIRLRREAARAAPTN